MILINSADYVVPELQVEYGKLPPCMLPLGNRRLVEHQVEIIHNRFGVGQDVIVSLPSKYELSDFDVSLFAQLSVDVIRVPEGLSLGDSVLYSINTAARSDQHLYMLHGDTVLGDFPDLLDAVGVSRTTENYSWQLEQTGAGSELIWCGFFSFSSVKRLVQALALSRGCFVESIKWYSSEVAGQKLLIDDWYDLGHLNTYFKSREKITTQRSFNDLRIGGGQVIKSGLPENKIVAEGQWFISLPPTLKKYAPQVFDVGRDTDARAYYCLEYLTLPPLNEIFVYGLNPPFFWKKIFNLVADLLAHFSKYKPHDKISEKISIDFSKLKHEKTRERLAAFSEQSVLNPSAKFSYSGTFIGTLYEVAEACIEKTLHLENNLSWIHGDLCFSNILFDSRADHIKVIDPRGLNLSGEMTPYGDQKYDLAKLSHSVIGLYDHIIAGRYALNMQEHNNIVDMSLNFDMTDRLEAIQHIFLQTEFIPGVSTKDIQPLVVLLFLSMLPLHADRPDRQRAMVANALRLFSDLD